MAYDGIHKWTLPRKLGRVPQVSTRFSLSVEMSRLTRDGTAKPVSRDQILRRERGQGNIHSLCSADHEQVWQSYPVDAYSDGFTFILFLYIQQYRHICTTYTMNAAIEPIHILSVHSYHDTASLTLLSSSVISTNEDQRIPGTIKVSRRDLEIL